MTRAEAVLRALEEAKTSMTARELFYAIEKWVWVDDIHSFHVSISSMVKRGLLKVDDTPSECTKCRHPARSYRMTDEGKAELQYFMTKG